MKPHQPKSQAELNHRSPYHHPLQSSKIPLPCNNHQIIYAVKYEYTQQPEKCDIIFLGDAAVQVFTVMIDTIRALVTFPAMVAGFQYYRATHDAVAQLALFELSLRRLALQNGISGITSSHFFQLPKYEANQYIMPYFQGYLHQRYLLPLPFAHLIYPILHNEESIGQDLMAGIPRSRVAYHRVTSYHSEHQFYIR